MGTNLVSVMFLLIIINHVRLMKTACPTGCSCTLSSITCCETERDFQIPITSSDNITKLSLSSCPRFVISKQSIWNLKSLEEIIIKSTAVTYIDAYAFGDLPKLKSLILNELNLSVTNIHPSAFNDLPIQQLDLKNNNLKLIHSEMFSGLKNLRVLELSRNKIAAIHNQAFDSLLMLSVLKLDYNHLNSVTPLWFKPFSNYSSLLISVIGNNLTNECTFRGVELTENHWFKKSLFPNDSLTVSLTNISICAKPMFNNVYQEMYVKESMSIALPCSATGLPRPSLTWLLPTGLEVAFSTSHLFVSNGKLNIATARPNDSGIYACVASNSEGTSVAVTRLSVMLNLTNAMTLELMVTETPKKKPSFALLLVFIIFLSIVLFFVVGYISRLIYNIAKKPHSDNFEFSRFVDTPNILPVPENPQPMPHV
ncbi:immunoglobulin superfamily member 10-like isoform X1 [Pseudophryne corroboree]|uniref:immunoglobulin superfamily member 10-like isoform X1 n=1 Tax=Pseudophryne corroboree TaxID=495146 RepID=UPI0030813170